MAILGLDIATFKITIDNLSAIGIPDAQSTPSLGIQDGMRNGLKSLEDLLSNSGSPWSCPFCAMLLPRGAAARLCLACGKPLGAATVVSWNGSITEHCLQFFLGLKDDLPSSRRITNASAATTSETGNISFPSEEPGTGIREPLNSESLLGSLLEDPSTQRGLAGGSLSPSHVHMFGTLSPSSSPIHKVVATVSGGPEDFFSQLKGLDALSEELLGESPVEQKEVDPIAQQPAIRLPDLSFLLAGHLLVPSDSPSLLNQLPSRGYVSQIAPQPLQESPLEGVLREHTDLAGGVGDKGRSSIGAAQVAQIGGGTSQIEGPTLETPSSEAKAQESGDEWGDFTN